MDHLFHIVERGTWALAESAGEYRPESLQSDGFVHFSFAGQVANTANRFYADAVNLCVVEFDPELLGAPVVLEDSHGTGEQFPHLYAPVPAAAAVAIHDLPRGTDGQYSFAAPGGGA